MFQAWIRGVGAVCSAGSGLPEIVATARAGLQTFGAPIFTPTLAIDAFIGEAKFAALPPTRSQDILKAALEEAMKDSGLPDQAWRHAGIFVGTTSGFSQSIDVENARQLEGQESTGRNSCPGVGLVAETVAAITGAQGPQYTFTTACTSSCIAAMEAWRMISEGDLDTAIVVGFESLLNITFLGFKAMMLYDKNGCRPFDKNRGGMTLGEGAGVLILSKQAPRENHSDVFCEILGASSVTEAGNLAAQARDGSSGEVLWERLTQAGKFLKSDVTAVKMHGTGTLDNDVSEAAAMRRVFLQPEQYPPFVGLKGLIGHTLGAAGGIEIALWTGFVRAGFLPKSVGFELPDSDLGISLSKSLLPAPTGIHVLQFFGFGGSSAAIALRYHKAVMA
ncbi:MAG: beta-ketoacyl synthase N-terminal-like domain-containing protein [Proteobacteria bacterium]|nr:beta-ketoacyl synthase N-terminal-like domain-containing protein [Pseudomonadota bacterium]